MMKVAISGNSQEAEDFKQQLSSKGMSVEHLKNDALPVENAMVFDFEYATPKRVEYLERARPEAIFLNIPFTTLSSVLKGRSPNFSCFGFNGLPGFSRNHSLEVSCLPGQNTSILTHLTESSKIEFNLIDDTIGLVSPRVVCMIINEAYYTFQEGTASKEDIDLSMRLGTNYPLGPFEWADKIGLKRVVELLDQVYHYTHDERYKVCTGLRMEAERITQP